LLPKDHFPETLYFLGPPLNVNSINLPLNRDLLNSSQSDPYPATDVLLRDAILAHDNAVPFYGTVADPTVNNASGSSFLSLYSNPRVLLRQAEKTRERGEDSWSVYSTTGAKLAVTGAEVLKVTNARKLLGARLCRGLAEERPEGDYWVWKNLPCNVVDGCWSWSGRSCGMFMKLTFFHPLTTAMRK
jgi:hypothetical protein